MKRERLRPKVKRERLEKRPRHRERLRDMYSEAICHQTRVRIRLALAAYAYEVLNTAIMSDGEFDKLALEVNTSIDTRRPDLDRFFRKHFSPHTGSWVWKHPDRKVLDRLVRAHFADCLVY